MSHPFTLAMPIGDPNGIGPEVAVKAAVALRERDDVRPILVGDGFVIDTYAREQGMIARQAESDAMDRDAIEMWAVEHLPAAAFRPGTESAAAGAATVAYLAKAVDALAKGHANAIVACPHSETAINSAGVAFAGYPGLLARMMGVPKDRVFLMLIGAGLRIVHVTLHERLPDALARITPDLVEAAALAVIETLRAQGVEVPRIGLFGINPHAGENGLFGDDDDRITVPAAARLRAAGHQVEGPIGADLLLGRRNIDAFVAMYHDQGHIPIKLLAGRDSSAMSIGAGILFASVGHGCAFDIAGKNLADPAAVLRTIDLLAGRGMAGAA